MRVVLAGGGTGGHLFPGLAVAREFQRRDPKTEILFIGTAQGIESRVLPKEGFTLETLTVRGIKGRGLRGWLDAAWGVPASLLRSWTILREFRPDCVIGLGVLIRGDTNHHELVGESVSHALQRVAIETGIPVINGVLVVNTLAQAKARSIGKVNRGVEFARAALEMAALRRKFLR